MSLLGNAKTMGGIGALLALIGIFVPTIGGILSIVGFVLVVVAVKNISDETKDKAIFNNYLYSFIIEIMAFASFFIVLFFTLQSVGGISYFMELQNMAYSDPMEIFSYLEPFLTGAIVAFFVLCIISILSTIFYKKSFDSISEHTGVKWFSTAALLMLIGAATLIIVIGIFIILVALIIQIVAFFSLPETLPKK